MPFAQPNILWLLLVLPPALMGFFWWSWRERQKLAALFIQTRLLPGLLAGFSPERRKIRFACLIFAVALLIVTLARPQWGFDWEEVKQRGLDIVVAIDTSKSMLAEDIAPNRLARAKLAALDLMQQAKSDRLGLVAFAGRAFLECPLTIDDTAFHQSVEALDVNAISEGGTAIAEAINTVLAAFKEGDNYKVLVLFTDGEDNDEGALEAAQNATKAGLRIFTIGIGTPEGELLRYTDAKGHTDYIRDEQGNVVKSHLNEALLQQIAGATEGGFYLPLRGAKTIDTLYEKGLAPLPKSEGKEKLVKRYHERYHWPLAAAIALLLVEMLFPERKRDLRDAKETRSTRSAPHERSAGRARVSERANAAVILALVACLPGVAFGSPSSALRDFKAGRYGEALKEYQRLSQQNTNDLRFVFNAGVAAYGATNFDEASKDFKLATLAPGLQLQQQAYYNLGNTQYRLGEQKFEPTPDGLDAMEEAWKEAIKSYTSAADLDKKDIDASYNLAFVKQRVDLIARLREAMRQAKQSADEAVRRAEFHRALEIMESLNNPIAAKNFQDYIKKLQDIDAIVTPPHS